MLDFAAKMARNHHEAGPDDIERLRQAGFSDAKILYIILWTANFNLANTITDSLGMEYHENFSANLGWLFGARAAAAAGPGAPGRERAHVPALEGAPLTWINSSPLTWFDARGRVLLVMYGDVMHPNTLVWLEHLERWQAEYAAAGWLALFVNTGEFPVAKEAATAAAEIARLGLTLPVSLDPTYRAIAGANNRYWPALHVVDRAGGVRFRHYGPDGVGVVAYVVGRLLEESAPAALEVPPDRVRRRWLHPDAGPELYAGFRDGLHRLGLWAPDGSEHQFELPDPPELHRLNVAGRWLVREEGLTLRGATGFLRVRYCAEQIGVFAGPSEAGPGAIRVHLDGQPMPARHAGDNFASDSTLVVDRHRFYWLARHTALETHELGLEVLTSVARIYRLNGLPFRGETEP